jgi:glucose/arabinose dehydrogenase
MSRTAILAGISLLALAACGDSQGGDPTNEVGNNPQLPDQNQYLFPPMHLAKVVGWKEGETPTVPAGLKIQALATGLQHPRSLYVLPNGDILVVESKAPDLETIKRPKDFIMGMIESWVTSGGDPGPSNRITLLRDADGDGKPEVHETFIDHLYSPFGVALVGSDLYVANTDAIMHYTYHDGDTKITDAGTEFMPLPGGPIDHHWTKSLTASPDGNELYVGVGSNSNITENGIEAEKNRADVLVVDRQTAQWRIFASGLRNPNGLTFEPTSKALWTVVNERDELGPDLVPDYLTSVKDGGFYGWPYSYYGQHVDTRAEPQRPDLVARAIVPDYAVGAHTASLGFTFYEGDALPSKYRGGAFVGQHGSWNRKPFSGYRVIFVPFDNGMATGKPEEILTGFVDAKGEAMGRPVGVAVGKRGNLLVADDVGGRVWRVTEAAGAVPSE